MTARPGTPRALAVVAGVLIDKAGQLLIAQRAADANDGGLWEFPGGKIAVGECATEALIRELTEEIGVVVNHAELFAVVRWRGPPRSLDLHTFSCRNWTGQPIAHEHQALRWLPPAQLRHYPMPAPDRPIRARLALPREYLITPEPDADADAFLSRLARTLENPRLGIVSLRAKACERARLAQLAESMLRQVRRQRPDLTALIHGEPELAMQLGFDGVHLSSRQLQAVSRRPVPESFWLFASCHNRAELNAAERLGADAVSLSPVTPTVSHPLATTLGWSAFAAAARLTWLPCFALGGLGPADLDRALASGAHGVAGIRAYWRS
ncbi:MAG: Nudix family hydrolase [Lysobacterales bacterium]